MILVGFGCFGHVLVSPGSTIVGLGRDCSGRIVSDVVAFCNADFFFLKNHVSEHFSGTRLDDGTYTSLLCCKIRTFHSQNMSFQDV